MKHTEGMLRDGALNEEVFIVTGGGTGLGKAMSEYFLRLGAKVIICSRKLEVLEKTAEELHQKTGGSILPVQCDVRQEEQVAEVLEQGVSKFGKVTGLVNNAAGNFISPTERVSPKGFATVMGIVLQGTYNFSYTLGNYWIQNKIPGRILNIVATFAWTGSGYVVPSASAKAGVLTMTKSLAVEWAKYGIRANAIAPGLFPTKGMMDRLFPENIREELDPMKGIPAKRAGETQELANLAAYLMSEYSAYVTGEVITLDGGAVLISGSMNHLDIIPNEMWDEIDRTIRHANKRK